MLVDSAADANAAFLAYEKIRHRLPNARFPTQTKAVDSLAEISGQIDVYLLDAFGVLNVGESAIPGAPQRIRELQEMGKTVMVVSNAAGYPKSMLLKKYAGLGFGFSSDDVLTSREVLLAALENRPAVKRGLVATQAFPQEELENLNAVYLGEDPKDYDEVAEFLLIGAAEWTEARQSLLEAALISNPRPVLVGNPDIVAPRENGLSKEPGYFAHRLADATGVMPEFFGKPFANVFEMAFARLPMNLDYNRVVMVGDTLQTDILGGCHAGVKTALITDFGALKGLDAEDAVARSGIVPDFIMPAP